MKLTIIFRDESREVECGGCRVNNGMLYIFEGDICNEDFGGKVIQIWNMNNIIGVEMDDGQEAGIHS
jgi:hypothetical protein